MEEYIYLDNAATTFPKPEAVYRALDRANRNAAVNAGRGSYALAEQAKQLIEDTRGLLLTLTKAKTAAEVVFTPSATFACNQIFGGLPWKRLGNLGCHPCKVNRGKFFISLSKTLQRFLP